MLKKSELLTQINIRGFWELREMTDKGISFVRRVAARDRGPEAPPDSKKEPKDKKKRNIH